MGFTRDKAFMDAKSRDIIFYVSELEETPTSGHFRKMDAEREIVAHISRSIPGSDIRKYTEYSGELLKADSIGIVFPAHSWGISLAVYTFLSHLKFEKDTYIYAVAVGESISGDVDFTVRERIKLLDQFGKIFSKKSAGNQSDIFVRCIDRKRPHGSTEEALRFKADKVTNIKHILSGLLFHTLDSINEMERLSEDDRYYYNVEDEVVSKKQDNIVSLDHYTMMASKKVKLSNIFLDDEVFAGVKLSRVM